MDKKKSIEFKQLIKNEVELESDSEKQELNLKGGLS
jgi:hypothetical protein